MFDLGMRNKRRATIVIKDHVIQFMDSRSGELTGIRSFGEKYLPEGLVFKGKIQDHENLQYILEEGIEEYGLKKRKLLFLVPDPFVVVRKIEIPADIRVEEMKGYLFLELGASIHLPFEDPVFDFYPLGGDDQEDTSKQSLLLFAAPEEIVEEYNQMFQKVGLDPIAADISPLSVYRLYHHMGLGNMDNEHLLMIQFNLQTVNTSIFYGPKIEFMRHMRMNMDLSGWKLERKVDEPDRLVWTGDQHYMEEEIRHVVEEIDRIMNFYRFSVHHGKRQITKILLTGDHPYLSLISEVVDNSFNLPIISSGEFDLKTTKGEPIPVSHHLTSGLSLKEVT